MDKINYDYVLIIIVLIIFLYFIYKYFTRKKIIHIDRNEIERRKFIERNKLNKTSLLKWLKKGNLLIGRIETITFFADNIKIKVEEKFKEILENEPKKISFAEIVVKPILDLKIFKIPFGKEICLIVGNPFEISWSDKTLYLEENKSFTEYFGVYIDLDYKKFLVEHHREDNVFRTDLETFASIYYAKGQEQAIFDPEYAFKTHIEQIKLEQEKEKRARITEGGV